MKTQPGKSAKPAAKSASKPQKKSGEVGGEKFEDDLEEDDLDTPKKAGKITANKDVDEDDELSDDADSWEKPEDDEDNWDPDFDEFDVPKSGAKSSIGKKAAKDDDDDFKLDDEFKDMFSGSGYDDKDDDDY